MDAELSLENIFDGEAPEVETVQEQPPVETEEKPETEQDTDVKTEDSSEESEAPPSDAEKPTVPIAALHGERDKRQEAQRENEQLKKQLEEFQQKKFEAPSVFDDENGAFDARLQQFDQKLQSSKFDQSKFFAEREFGAEVVAQKFDAFAELAKSDPLLNQRIHNAVSPYHEMVDIVDRHEKLEKLENVDQIEAEIEARVRKQIEQEFTEKQKAKDELHDSIPTSLAGEASQGGLSGSDWSGPPSLESVLDS